MLPACLRVAAKGKPITRTRLMEFCMLFKNKSFNKKKIALQANPGSLTLLNPDYNQIHEGLMCSYSLWDHFSIASKRVPGTKFFGNSKDSR